MTKTGEEKEGQRETGIQELQENTDSDGSIYYNNLYNVVQILHCLRRYIVCKLLRMTLIRYDKFKIKLTLLNKFPNNINKKCCDP